jgi:cytosine/adenosine deaminase-related metal-dependent hydrolase
MTVEYLDGVYYLDGRFHRGYVAMEDGAVTEVGRTTPGEPAARGVILPALWNCHTHVGDAHVVAPRGLGMTELVAWPDGYKHRAHREATFGAKMEGMRKYVRDMGARGTAGFIDFREEGREGLACLEDACRGIPMERLALGRPARLPSMKDDAKDMEGWKEEGRQVLDSCGGFGLSGMGDVPYDVVRELADMARRGGKKFAIHLSEGEREDVDKALDLTPSHVVHMCAGTSSDMERLADAGVPVVLCPSSNRRFDRCPDVTSMLDAGLDLALGTDNAMFGPPDLPGEARLLVDSGVQTMKALSILLEGPKKILRPVPRIGLEPGFAGGVAVYDAPLERPEKGLLREDMPPPRTFTRLTVQD